MLSVIVPTLNEEKLLPRMLQQFTPELVQQHGIEVIVSDGGSTDATVAIARRHAHKVIEETRGLRQTISRGRNLGAKHASGEVLVFLNADTLLKDIDQFFRRVRNEISQPGVVALTCSVEVYPGEQQWSDRWFHGFYNRFFALMNRVGMAMGRGECHIIRREAFFRASGYAQKIAAGEDYDMFRRIATMGKVKFMRDVVVYESPRRYRKYGYTCVTASWFLNFLSVVILRRSLLSEWKPVR